MQKGAALMTGTRVEIERVTKNKEMKVNRVLAETFLSCNGTNQTPEYTDEEILFAKEIQRRGGAGKMMECISQD